MTLRIYKYVMEYCEDPQTFMLPVGAQVVHVHEQSDGVVQRIVLWALQHDAALMPRTFQFFGTGNKLPEGCPYVGTAHIGAFVWHVFEVGT